MRLITIICTTTFLLFAVVASPAKAEVLVNEWQEFAFPVPNNFGCSDESGVASGVLHSVVTNFRKGGLGIHINVIGIWKGVDSGVELSWKDNITDIVPIGDLGNHFVGTFSESLKIIGPGGLLFRLNAKAHLTEVGGEFIVYFDEVTTVCNT
jgi:hypothetical protein